MVFKFFFKKKRKKKEREMERIIGLGEPGCLTAKKPSRDNSSETRAIRATEIKLIKFT